MVNEITARLSVELQGCAEAFNRLNAALRDLAATLRAVPWYRRLAWRLEGAVSEFFRRFAEATPEEWRG